MRFLSLLLAGSALLLPQVAAHDVSARRAWAHYRRQVEAGTATQADLPRISPVSGATITKSIQQQIKSDVNAVLEEFKGLPENAQNVLKTAFNQILNQKIYTLSPEQQYSVISSAIQTQLQKVQDSLPVILGDIAQLDDTHNLKAMQDCIMAIVSMGGRKTDEDGSCLSTSGFSIDSLTQQFNSFVDVNQFTIPTDKVNSAAADITAYLNSVELVPQVEYIIGNASQAIQNVIDTTAAKDRDATRAAFNCWINAIQEISEVPLAERQIQCDSGLAGTSAPGAGTSQSTLDALQERYIAITNQYAGILPANLALNIQALGVATLSVNIGAYDSAVRDKINSAILSATASTAGESASLIYDLMDCLDTIYDDTPADTCNPNDNPNILLHNQNVYYNYLSQFVSILPKVLIQELNSTVQAQLDGNDSPDAEALRKQLEALWENARLGSEYESCERTFVDCSIAAVVQGSATTDCTSSKGDICSALPSLTPDRIDSSNPYGEISDGLEGSGTWGQKKRALKAKRAAAESAKKHLLHKRNAFHM